MAHFTRREFLQTGLAAGTLAVAGALPLSARRGSATDVVTLGRSGVKVTRLRELFVPMLLLVAIAVSALTLLPV